MVVKISCLSFFYPVAKLKPYLNPAYCLDRGFIFLPGHLNLSGEKDSHTSKVMLKILQARLQQYINHKLPVGLRKGRGTRDQIVSIQWITEKAREFQKNIYLCFID